MPKHKLDIFRVLDHISIKDRDFFNNLSEEEQKALAPSVVMRWLSGTRNAQQIYLLNALVNTQVFSNYKHKPLLYFLMTICSPGKKQRYHWNKVKSKTTIPNIVSVIRRTFGYSSKEASEVIPLLSNDDIIEYAEDLGLQKEELAKVKKELKNR